MRRLHRALLMPWTNKVNYTQIVQSLGPIAYWPQAEPSGTVSLDESGNGRNGIYTGVTLGNAGIGDGRTSAGFDGATSYNNIYSVSLAGAFNSAEGTCLIWGKVFAAGVWTDAAFRRLFVLQTDNNNRVTAYKDGANNTISVLYVAGGTIKSLTITTSTVDWFSLGITWSVSADQVRVYFNGTQSGATLTGLGVWVGAIAATTTVVGAQNTTPAQVWSGTLAHAAVWSTPLGAAQIARLAVVP